MTKILLCNVALCKVDDVINSLFFGGGEFPTQPPLGVVRLPRDLICPGEAFAGHNIGEGASLMTNYHHSQKNHPSIKEFLPTQYCSPQRYFERGNHSFPTLSCANLNIC